MRANRLTQRLRSLEGAPARGSLGAWSSHADGVGCSIRVANDLEGRRRAYELVYRLYLEKEYTKPHPSRMWLSIFDALPETTTLTAERDGTIIGAITVVPDSPLGLPADGLYSAELDGLRASGRRLAEIVSLGIYGSAEGGAEALLRLFNSAYLLARGVRGATDFVITVNPRHVRFYERLMLFSAAGPERGYDRVGGAPAVLLRLDFDVAERQRVPGSEFLVPGSTGNQEPGSRNARSIYSRFRSVAEAPGEVAALRRELRPMCEAELGFFMVAETDLLARAAPEQRALLQERYPTCDIESLVCCARKEAV